MQKAWPSFLLKVLDGGQTVAKDQLTVASLFVARFILKPDTTLLREAPQLSDEFRSIHAT
jgi:hypothetical protein